MHRAVADELRPTVRESSHPLLPGAALALLLAGGVVWLIRPWAAHAVWLVALVATGAPLLWRTLREIRHGRFATDVVAALSIIGAIALDQPFAGLVIVLMQSGGEALEAFAERRASGAVRALEAAAPRVAHRVDGDLVRDVPAAEIAIGDTLLIRPGDQIPCDGVITDGASDLDVSRLTGEPLPVSATPGIAVLSGTFNGSGVLRMRATAPAADSQYARIVELVRSAQASQAPLQRMADRYAVWFTPATLLVCGVAFWVTGDWLRVLAVLVVATPCPLILAAPVAFVGGLNRGARRKIIIRSGAALEQLARADVVAFDKTGTITIGEPRIERVIATPGFEAAQVLQYAGAAEEGSSHALARVIVEAARERGPLPQALQHAESAGAGMSAVVDGHGIRVGSRSFVDGAIVDAGPDAESDSGLRAYVSIDEKLGGVIQYADAVRSDAPALLTELRRLGLRRILMLSGDRAANARDIAARVGIGEVFGDLLPSDKLLILKRLQREGHVVIMVGDGTNDAPALEVADVGVAIAERGRGGITTEAADVILLGDALQGVSEAVRIGRETTNIARQSIVVGLGLSIAMMMVAAAGYVGPAVGALAQEAVDVAVIANALRASVGLRLTAG